MRWPKITAVLTGKNNNELTEFVTAKLVEFTFERIVFRCEWDIKQDMSVHGILFSSSFDNNYSFKDISGRRELKKGDTFIFTWTRYINSIHTETF